MYLKKTSIITAILFVAINIVMAHNAIVWQVPMQNGGITEHAENVSPAHSDVSAKSVASKSASVNVYVVSARGRCWTTNQKINVDGQNVDPRGTWKVRYSVCVYENDGRCFGRYRFGTYKGFIDKNVAILAVIDDPDNDGNLNEVSVTGDGEVSNQNNSTEAQAAV